MSPNLVLPLINVGQEFAIPGIHGPPPGVGKGTNVLIDSSIEKAGKRVCLSISPFVPLSDTVGSTTLGKANEKPPVNIDGACTKAKSDIVQSKAEQPRTLHLSSTLVANDSSVSGHVARISGYEKQPDSSSKLPDTGSAGVALMQIHETPVAHLRNPQTGKGSSTPELASSSNDSETNPTSSPKLPSPNETDKTSDVPLSIGPTWKRDARREELTPVATEHDRSFSGSTLTNTPIKGQLTPVSPYFDNITINCAPLASQLLFHQQDLPCTSSSSTARPKSRRLEDNVSTTQQGSPISPAHRITLEAIKERLSPENTPLLEYIEEVKASYQESEDVDWITLGAWTQLWHRKEVGEQEARHQIEVANLEAKLKTATGLRNNVVRTSNEQRAKNICLVQENQICTTANDLVKRENKKLLAEVKGLKEALNIERETSENTKRGMEKILNQKTSMMDAMVFRLEQLERHIDFLSSNNPMAETMIRFRNEALSAKDKIQDQNRESDQLRETLEFTRNQTQQLEAENARLRAENKVADLEVGFVHAKNAQYRHELEDGDPARTAAMDCQLKRMAEERQRLAEQLAEYGEALGAEKRGRETDQKNSANELAQWKNRSKFFEDRAFRLESSRDAYRQHNEDILEKLKSKLYRDDVVVELARDKEVLRQDNEFLIVFVQERELRIQDAVDLDTKRKGEINELGKAMDKTKEKHRRLEVKYNSLDLEFKALDLKQEMEEPFVQLKAQNENLSRLTEQQAHYINDILNRGPTRILREQVDDKAHTIEELQAEITKLHGYCAQWRQREIESQPDFDYLYKGDEVVDWKGREHVGRLKLAEKAYRDILKKLEDGIGPGEEPWAERLPCTEGKGMYFGTES